MQISAETLILNNGPNGGAVVPAEGPLQGLGARSGSMRFSRPIAEVIAAFSWTIGQEKKLE